MAGKQKKTIITCAITGAIHTPTMSDALPYTADDIASQAIAAAEAGAAILHLHARRPEDGGPGIAPNCRTHCPRGSSRTRQKVAKRGVPLLVNPR